MAWQFASGNILTAADLNAVTIPWNALCQLVQTSAQNLANNTAVNVSFPSGGNEELDPLAWHNPVSNDSRITPTIAGWYQSVAAVMFSSDSDYVRISVDVTKNGAAITQRAGQISFLNGAGTVGPVITAPSVLIQLNGSTDYLELQLLQSNTSAATNTATCHWLVKLVYPT